MANQPIAVGNLIQSAFLVASGQKLSAPISTAGMSLCGLLLPVMTSTAVTFMVCDTIGGTYVALHSTISGTPLSYTVASSGYYAIDPKDFAGVLFLKLQFGTNEGADRNVIVSMKGI